MSLLAKRVAKLIPEILAHHARLSDKSIVRFVRALCPSASESMILDHRRQLVERGIIRRSDICGREKTTDRLVNLYEVPESKRKPPNPVPF